MNPGPSAGAFYAPLGVAVQQLPPGLGSAAMSGQYVRCVCGKQWPVPGVMIQCGECRVWQHCPCMGYDAAAAAAGAPHLCERCRVDLADPFWASEHWLAVPLQMEACQPVAAKAEDSKRALFTFKLTEREQQLLAESKVNPELQLQVVCISAQDSGKAPCRVHWPMNAQLLVNGTPQQCRRNYASRELGANARDSPVNVSPFTFPKSTNKLLLTCHGDKNAYVAALRFARKRSDEAVRGLMAPPESMTDAIARMSLAAQRADDLDDDIIIAAFKVNLKCPLSGMRVGVPARFTDVGAFCVFDLEFFLDSVKRTRKWQCPASMKNSHVRHLQKDIYLERVLAHLANTPEVMEVEVDGRGLWRPDAGAEWRNVLDPTPPPVAAPPPDSEGSSESKDSFEEMLRKRRASGANAAAPSAKRSGAANGAAAAREIVDLCDSDDDPGPPQPARLPSGSAPPQPFRPGQLAAYPAGVAPSVVAPPPLAQLPRPPAPQMRPPTLPLSAYPTQ